ncbi:hypothetical protein NPIL_615841 [Nephila pilipes]|uniref:Uncharacterized protein n=1 Tax=Nephila pilipes TaxID=299642 RepID=A0A8X6QGB4_NEPPI|nr:hypothetical protein NPIL_615841 [Nephila pilipes]
MQFKTLLPLYILKTLTKITLTHRRYGFSPSQVLTPVMHYIGDRTRTMLPEWNAIVRGTPSLSSVPSRKQLEKSAVFLSNQIPETFIFHARISTNRDLYYFPLGCTNQQEKLQNSFP